VQSHTLAGPHLGERVDVVIDDHAGDWVSARDRVIGAQDDR
jgi:hypothetical protein